MASAEKGEADANSEGSSPLSLTEAARLLGLAQPTLLFWLEAFQDELGLESRLPAALEAAQLEKLKRIRRLILDERRSISETRLSLALDAGSSADKADPSPQKSWEEPGPADAPTPGPRPAAPVQAAGSLDSLVDQVARLRAETAYLADEAKASQRLLARLVRMMEDIAEALAAVPEVEPQLEEAGLGGDQSLSSAMKLSQAEWDALLGDPPHEEELGGS